VAARFVEPNHEGRVNVEILKGVAIEVNAT
jgi:hypothetical protein